MNDFIKSFYNLKSAFDPSRTTYKNTSIILIIVTSAIAGLSLIVFARYGNIHTDEGWSFYEAVSRAKGFIPYIDFFSHRLPLNTDIYGLWLNLIGLDLMSGRLFSVILSVLSTGILTYSLRQCQISVGSILIGFCVLWNLLVMHALATVTTYATGYFLFALSCLVLVSSNFSPRIVAALFLCVQGFIWSLRYIVDVQLLVIITFLILSINRLNWTRKDTLIIIISVSIAFIYALRTLWFFGDQRIFFDTINYNFNQVPLMKDFGLIPESLSNPLARIFFLRKLELITYYPIFIVGIMAYIYLIPKTVMRFPNWLKNKQTNLLIYSMVFVTLYYGAYIILSYDFPITKVYILPAIVVLVAFSADNFLKIFINNRRKYFTIATIAILGTWPLVQQAQNRGEFILNRHNHIDDLNQTIEQLQSVVPAGAYVLTFNPLLSQAGYELEKGLSMELYSLLNSFNDEDAEYHHLITPSLIGKKIRNQDYDALFLEENRFFLDKHMGRILNQFRQSWIADIEEGYELKKEINTYYRGTLFVYVRKT